MHVKPYSIILNLDDNSVLFPAYLYDCLFGFSMLMNIVE